jgi:hypothetical protein
MFKGGMANHIAAELEKFCPVEACEIEWSTKYRKVHIDFYIIFLLETFKSSRNRTKIGAEDIRGT